VGLFDFFKRRRERETALAPPSARVTPPSAGATPPSAQADQPVVGQQFQSAPPVTGAGGFDVSSLGRLAGFAEAMKQAPAQGNAQVTQSSQSLDLRGTGRARRSSRS
jgi:hypothetical protein